jgi:hypothetical protein
MSTTLISQQRTRDQHENDEHDDALFAFRENESPEQAFHFLA